MVGYDSFIFSGWMVVLPEELHQPHCYKLVYDFAQCFVMQQGRCGHVPARLRGVCEGGSCPEHHVLLQRGEWLPNLRQPRPAAEAPQAGLDLPRHGRL